MPRILLLSSLLLVLLSAVASKALRSDPFIPAGLDEVVQALRSGNAGELGRHIDDQVEISLPEKSDAYGRPQAVLVLKDFFASNAVTGFEVQFKGENGNSRFCVGRLLTRSGNYRTTVFLKTRDGRQWVKELRFVAM